MASKPTLVVINIIKQKWGSTSVPLVGCEIGVYTGLTSVALLQTFPHLFLFMVDPWQSKGLLGSMKRNRSQRYMDNVFNLVVKEVEFAKDRSEIQRIRSVAGSVKHETKSLDFAFIDANHKYEHAWEDVMAWWPKIKKGGVLMGHDYNGNMEKKGLWGVKKAVDKFAAKRDLEVVVNPHLVWSIEK